MINVYPDVEYQEMLGFGGAITETSAYNFMKLSESRRNELAKAYFDATEGLGLNFCRVSIGSNDFALDDSPYVSNNDPKLTTFSIDRDRRYVIPMIKAAQRYCGELYLMATPWSPPAFMKDNGKTINGGKLLPEHRNTWADYIVRFLQEYKKEGINFFCMTVQNEPKASQKWQSCLYSGKEEGEYAVDFLKPHLDKAGFDTLKLIVWDHNKERVLERASESFAVPKARKAIWGVAFHWYSGKHFDQLRMTHERFPEKHLILSEFCKGPATGGTHVPYGDWSDAEDYCAEMIGDFNNYACASIDWNMIVDTKGGPCLYRDDIGGGKASVVADAENNSFELQSTYYAVGHFSKYVKRGARRIGNSTYDDVNLDANYCVIPSNGSKWNVYAVGSNSLLAIDGNGNEQQVEHFVKKDVPQEMERAEEIIRTPVPAELIGKWETTHYTYNDNGEDITDVDILNGDEWSKQFYHTIAFSENHKTKKWDRFGSLYYDQWFALDGVNVTIASDFDALISPKFSYTETWTISYMTESSMKLTRKDGQSTQIYIYRKK